MSAPAASLYIPHGEFLLGHPYTSKSLESPKEIYIPKERERETHAAKDRERQWSREEQSGHKIKKLTHDLNRQQHSERSRGFESERTQFTFLHSVLWTS